VTADAASFLQGEVEARMRTRPRFLARTPVQALVQLRRRLDEETASFAEAALGRLVDLNAWYAGAVPAEAEEAAAVTRALADLTDLTHRVLATYGFPGDARSDDADDGSLDVAPSYELDYEPAPQVLWAWRQLRSLETAVRAAERNPTPPTFELRFHLPEALPPTPLPAEDT
jgi:hypothetical protein